MTLARDVQAVRTRARIQRWQFRQRNLAHGAWGRFRLVLAHADVAYVIDEATAAALSIEGFVPDASGAGLEPPRTIIWITPARAARLRLDGAMPVRLRLDATLLASRCLALVPFAQTSGASSVNG